MNILKKLLQLYREIVEKQAESTGSRQYYRQIVEDLKNYEIY